MKIHRPALSAAVGFIAGALVAHQGFSRAGIVAGLLLALATAIGGALYSRRLPAPGRRHRFPWMALSFTVCLSLGAARYGAYEAGLHTKLSGLGEGLSVTVEGTAVGQAEVDGDRAVLRLRVAGWQSAQPDPSGAAYPSTPVSANETILLSIKLLKQEEQGQAAVMQRGDRLRAVGTVQLPAAAANFGGFDYRRYLERRSIFYTLQVKGMSAVQLAPSSLSWTDRILRYNDGLRERTSRLLGRLFPGSQAGYMQGLLIGERAGLDPDDMRTFSDLGLTHILAISGLHIALFAWALTAILRRLGTTKEWTGRIVMSLIPAYVLFTGASSSIVRAGVTTSAGLAAAGLGWGRDALSLLSAAALCMLWADPSLLQDIGFQLSFLVTAGLITGSGKVRSLLPRKPGWLWDSAAVAVTAQLVSFPLTIASFHQFSLLSLPANLLLVPIISFVTTPAGYAAAVAGALWLPLGQALAFPVIQLNRLTFWTAEALNTLPGRLIWPSPPAGWTLAYYAVCAGAIISLNRLKAIRLQEGSCLYLLPDGPAQAKRSRWTAIAMSGLLMLLLLAAYMPIKLGGGGEGRVEFLSVGQGDSALIRTPEGRTMLIDGGGTLSFQKTGEEWKRRRDPYEVGRKTLVPLLMQRGIHRLDTVLISHEDADHIGGLRAVLERIPVSRILFNGTLKSSPAALDLFRLALDKRIPLIPVHEGMTLQLDGASSLTVLNPEPRAGPETVVPADDQNPSTVVALLQMNGVHVLFTGDIGSDQESAILARIGKKQRDDVQVDLPLVLKVAHHGSKSSTSAEWLAYWKPAVSVISVGRNNVYGHPNGAVLGRLADSGSIIFRTDLDGEVEARVEPGGRLSIRTALGQ